MKKRFCLTTKKQNISNNQNQQSPGLFDISAMHAMTKCPVCQLDFSRSQIQQHASTCQPKTSSIGLVSQNQQDSKTHAQCPICDGWFPHADIEAHVDNELSGASVTKATSTTFTSGMNTKKKKAQIIQPKLNIARRKNPLDELRDMASKTRTSRHPSPEPLALENDDIIDYPTPIPPLNDQIMDTCPPPVDGGAAAQAGFIVIPDSQHDHASMGVEKDDEAETTDDGAHEIDVEDEFEDDDEFDLPDAPIAFNQPHHLKQPAHLHPHASTATIPPRHLRQQYYRPGDSLYGPHEHLSPLKGFISLQQLEHVDPAASQAMKHYFGQFTNTFTDGGSGSGGMMTGSRYTSSAAYSQYPAVGEYDDLPRRPTAASRGRKRGTSGYTSQRYKKRGGNKRRKK